MDLLTGPREKQTGGERARQSSAGLQRTRRLAWNGGGGLVIGFDKQGLVDKHEQPTQAGLGGCPPGGGAAGR
jgi:hypothetical protein